MREGEESNPAVFLDRDGVLTALVWNPTTGDYEPPHQPDQVSLLSGVGGGLQKLMAAGYQLIVISNQPDAAKGKCRIEDLEAVHERFVALLRAEGVTMDGAYYCYHHPDGVVPPYGGPCGCRKPGTDLLHRAARDFMIDMPSSWMVGDRDSDIQCGAAAGCRTVLIQYPFSFQDQRGVQADHVAKDLSQAVHVILTNSFGEESRS